MYIDTLSSPMYIISQSFQELGSDKTAMVWMVATVITKPYY